ncbi:M23 family metallopeptidase [Cyanobium sp. NS01]|uniref:M23 family metallopeptidase n=1 Tax=Cyanobium sp. NS01 TaxID=261284 RepID=UPI001645D819|nr:peptidoglycan DD-metalloendopeptidase family protein [Cyanobium sp. NS01]QNI71351.1 peptidase M23 family protein [Cyanobium sp. NS01]
MARLFHLHLLPAALVTGGTLIGLVGLGIAQERSPADAAAPSQAPTASEAPAAAAGAAATSSEAGSAAGAEPRAGRPLRRPPTPAAAVPAPRSVPPASARDSPPAASFDSSLDALVREGVVTPAERERVRSGSRAIPFNSPANVQACSSGALSAQECRRGVVVRGWGRPGSSTSASGGLLGGDAGSGITGAGQRLIGGAPLTTPLTVPVAALLAGSGGGFRLADVFAVTPRPSPIGGNGNRRLLFPLIGSAVTSSGFGFRVHPVLGSWLMHAGRDLAAPEGTPVVASLSGQVISSGVAGGYGLAIEIEHERPRRRTLYGHLSELYVKPGDRVRQGEVIGRVGSTGLSTGPHLHFELRLPADGGWLAVDPGDLDPGRAAGGSDAIALLMGQLLQSLERPVAPLAPAPPAG